MPVKNAVIITSNRDEHTGRANAAAPDFYVDNSKKIIFPKDPKAGGTWFAASESGTVAVLLNGAFRAHVASPPYRKSRGLILLEIIESDDPHSCFNLIDLDNIEPFTVILYQAMQLYELRWDGNKKYEQLLPATENQIWSSSTLYTDAVIKTRETLFDKFIRSGKNIKAESVIDFHADNNNDAENGFIIDRGTGMKTFSITQAIIEPGNIRFLHHDLLQHKLFEKNMPVNRATIHA